MNDKTKHTLIGFAFGLSALPLIYILPLIWVIVVTFISASIVFIGKELHDIPTTGFDKKDLEADYVGLLAGWFVSFFVLGVIVILKL